MTLPTSASDADHGGSSTPTPTPELHRIYWQQWLVTTTAATTDASTASAAAAVASYHTGPGSAVATTTTSPLPPRLVRQKQRQLITSSAAVRIAKGVAQAEDVTKLMRKTLHLKTEDMYQQESSNTEQESNDALVLVGTIQVPEDYVSFDHETILRQQWGGHDNAVDNDNKEDDHEQHPFHLVKSIWPKARTKTSPIVFAMPHSKCLLMGNVFF